MHINHHDTTLPQKWDIASMDKTLLNLLCGQTLSNWQFISWVLPALSTRYTYFWLGAENGNHERVTNA